MDTNTKLNMRTIKALAKLLDDHKLESIEANGIKLVKSKHTETVYVKNKVKEEVIPNQSNGEPDYRDIFPPELFPGNYNH